ncbi:hypothetical protein F5B19DRAFT_117010 [Rostrohypoxylon terebratum]|nr:hypothetical protein F5B19DRAFT_117010 [Rostrohypoxylon terebratum]
MFNEKVVPDESSHMQDNRDRRERLNANHMQMCRFTGEEDSEYAKVGPELKGIYVWVIAEGIRQSTSDECGIFAN